MRIELLYKYYLASGCVSTDSRHLQPGSIFFALNGENFDGNKFAGEAIKKGACLSVISDPLLKGDQYVYVKDPLESLQKLATFHRKQLDCPLLAITGSNGKTTTKELILTVLAQKYQTYGTKGNLNNHIGVPLSILSIPQDAEIAVIEMGANHTGEIAFLCKIAQPTHGLITNIGKAHLEGFRGLEGVKKAKSELYEYLGMTGGFAFVNQDEQYLIQLSQSVSRRLSYGLKDEPERDEHLFLAKPVESDKGVRLKYLDSEARVRELESTLFGAFNRANILSALAVGSYFDVSPESMNRAIEDYTAGDNRSQVLWSGSNVLILDAYNANPSSMRGAISSFASFPGNRKVLILGGMKELGSDSAVEHAELVQYVKSFYPWNKIILIGEEFNTTVEEGIEWFPSTEACLTYLKGWTPIDTSFLVKGSRAYRMEALAGAIKPSGPA